MVVITHIPILYMMMYFGILSFQFIYIAEFVISLLPTITRGVQQKRIVIEPNRTSQLVRYRIYKEWSPICLKETNNYALIEGLVLLKQT